MVKYHNTPVYVLCDLEAGDHVRIKRSPVWHHMLVIKVIDSQRIKVIHYTGSGDGPHNSAEAFGAISSAISSRTFDSAEIMEEILKIDLSNETLELLRYLPGVAVYSGTQAIQRVRKKLGEREYCLFTNNCEHLINWAITGKKESGQIDTVVQAGKAAAFVAAVGIAAGAFLYAFSGHRTTNSDDEEEEDSD